LRGDARTASEGLGRAEARRSAWTSLGATRRSRRRQTNFEYDKTNTQTRPLGLISQTLRIKNPANIPRVDSRWLRGVGTDTYLKFPDVYLQWCGMIYFGFGYGFWAPLCCDVCGCMWLFSDLYDINHSFVAPASFLCDMTHSSLSVTFIPV